MDDAFSKWFYGSKIVRKDGSPLVVYHRTDADFPSFEARHSNGWSEPREGFYFTDDPTSIDEIGKIEIRAYLSIKNPAFLRQKDPGSEALYVRLKLPGMKDRLSGATVQGQLQTSEFIAHLKQEGFDGMVFNDNLQARDMDSFVAFSPNQIKVIEKKKVTENILTEDIFLNGHLIPKGTNYTIEPSEVP